MKRRADASGAILPIDPGDQTTSSTLGNGPVDWAWITALPKAEVHLHLEGCLTGDLVRRSAERHQVPLHPAMAGGRPHLNDLPQLLQYLSWSCGLIDRAEDLTTIAYDAAMRVTASGTRHIDVIVNPTHWPYWHGRLGPMVAALDEGFGAAEADGHATATLCVSLSRSQSRGEALELVRWVVAVAHPRISALSIDGDESAGSHTERFREAFVEAAEGGLHRCVHAGESSGPQGVREAIRRLLAERIDHGVRAVEDPSLVAELVERDIPLDICPTSNIMLGVVPDLAAHPMELLRRAGVRVSLNTDDPALYGIDVAEEYQKCADLFSWTRSEVAVVARTSIESAFAPAARKAELLADLDAFLAH